MSQIEATVRVRLNRPPTIVFFTRRFTFTFGHDYIPLQNFIEILRLQCYLKLNDSEIFGKKKDF